MCVYVDQNKGTPHQKWHIHWEFVDFKSIFWFTTKIYPRLIFIFKWMPSNNSWYKFVSDVTKLFEAISTMYASFFSKPLSQLECRDNKKSCHLLGKKGTYPMRMHDNNTTCNRSNQNAGFLDTTNTTCNRSNQNARLPDTHSRSTNQHPAAPDTTKTTCYWSAAQCWKAFLVEHNGVASLLKNKSFGL